MKKTVFIILLLNVFNCHSQEKKMCITVDDLPVVSYGVNDINFHQKLTKKLLNTFNKYAIPAIGYVNEGKLFVEGRLDSSRVKVLELWLKNGYELGNHTYSHLNYHNSTYDQYTKNIIKGEKVTKNLSRLYNRNVQYFRHPYLRSGLRKSHADSLNTFLLQNGYTEAPVTIDNEDYLFAKAYHNAFQQKDSSQMSMIGNSYIDYMEAKLLYFEKLSDLLFDRNISQTLLFHVSLLNSDYLDELIKMYKSHNYGFVSQTEVLKDEAYNEEITEYRNWGISWIERWAMSREISGENFKADPKTPDFIKALAK